MPVSLAAIVRRGQWTCRSCLRRFISTRKQQETLPDYPARTRFAPSPTGNLHLGSLRTALFNYLLAKATGGQFLLRIEDTDRNRTVPGAIERLYDDLRWAGLHWDEGPLVGGPYSPYIQSERTTLYQEHAQKLLRSGHAYRCFCSPQRLYDLAQQRVKLGLPAYYDRACAGISKEEAEDRAARGERNVIRLKVPDILPAKKNSKQKKSNLFSADVTGHDDPVLLKSDGLPTYHLANVVDDYNMKITHVIRGVEWTSSTEQHLLLYKAFDWEAPQFHHVGLLLDTNGQKLSKRNFGGDLSVFRNDMAIVPQALINFLALLGWAHEERDDYMTMDDLIKRFTLKFSKGNQTVTLEKLWYLQKRHVEHLVENGGKQFEDLVDGVTKIVQENTQVDQGILKGRDLRQYITSIFQADPRNFTTAKEFYNRSLYFFAPVINEFYSSRHLNGKDIHPVSVRILIKAAGDFENIPPKSWTTTGIRKALLDIAAKMSNTPIPDPYDSETDMQRAARIKRNTTWSRGLHHYLRWAIAESKPGPPIADTMAILGRNESLARLKNAAFLAREGDPAKDRSQSEMKAVKN